MKVIQLLISCAAPGHSARRFAQSSLFLVAMLGFSRLAFSQCEVLNNLSAIHAPNVTLTANMECTDAAGWTHYYNSTAGKLLLSIKKNGQNIGSLGAGLTVEAGTLSGYGSGAYDLSGADYIDNDIWPVANRYWQIKGANPISAPIKIRFYFHGEDVEDIAQSVDDYGFFVDQPEDLLMFTISSGGGLYPLSTATQQVNANLTLFDMTPGPAPDWTSGVWNGFPFGEFEVNTSDIGGGAGFLIFVQNEPLAVSGKILKANGTPVPQVTVQAGAASTCQSNAGGNYACPNLPAGGNYEIIPEKNTNPAQDISTVDLIALSRHLLGIEILDSPYSLIAADANSNGAIDFSDQNLIRKVLLGSLPAFPGNASWRFVPADYVFPDPQNPFSPSFPESIWALNLFDTLDNQDFTGIKIGDVAEEDIFPPPVLNTSFSLPELTTCNPGDTLAFPLTVQDFENIRAFQFTLEWSAGKMQFLGAANFNLVGFNDQSIGTSAAGQGKLTFAWFNPYDAGSTMSDGAVVCTLRFIATGDYDQSTSLTFSGSVTPVLLLHQDLSEDVPAFQNGKLLIENNSTLTASANIQPGGCNGMATGSIDLSVSGEAPPLNYHWSNGATSQDLANLPGGNYRVTVSDNSGNCPKVFFFNVPGGTGLQLGGSVSHMSCPNEVDGSIDLEVAGGVAPFDFQWSNGSQNEDLNGLFQGNYSVTVTDAASCTGTSSFSVGNPNLIFPAVSIVNASSETAADGAVLITSISGAAPFSFLWNTGATTQTLQNVPMGDYIVTITDGAGCQHVFGYLVNFLTVAAKEENVESFFSLFPNPVGAGQQLNLLPDPQVSGDLTAAVFSMEGKKVAEFHFDQQGERRFSAPKMPGAYLLHLEMENGAPLWRWFLVK